MNDLIENLKRNHFVATVGIILALLVAVLVPLFYAAKHSGGETVVATTNPTSTATETKPDLKNEFPNTNLVAKTAIVWAVDEDKIIYGDNAKTIMPLASLTKLMTAVVVSEHLGSDVSVRILPQDLATDGENGLQVGESWSAHDLINFMLTVSSNDAAAALRRKVEESGIDMIEEMNRRTKELGLSHMSFANASGLDVIPGSQAGAAGTAQDVALLLDYIITEKPELVEITTKPQVLLVSDSGISHQEENTNSLAGTLIGLRAGKTGFTDTAGGNLAVAFEPILGEPTIAVVLGSTKESRFDDISQLIANTRTYLTSK